MRNSFLAFLTIFAALITGQAQSADINLSYSWAGKADGNTVQLGEITGRAGTWEGALSVTSGDGPFANAKSGHIQCIYSVGHKTIAECAINFVDIDALLYFVLEVIDGKRISTVREGTGVLEGLSGGCEQTISGRPNGWLTGQNVCRYSL